jgi:hypothetical protein
MPAPRSPPDLVFLGTSREGIEVPGTTEPARLIFVVLTPEDRPQEHLDRMAEIVRLTADPDGALIAAYPVAAVNLFIVFVNLYFLWGMLRTREFFRLLEVHPGSEYLRFFLDFHAADVRRFFPHLDRIPAPGELNVFVLRGSVPAGLLVGERQGDTLRVVLDFVIPQFRDFKVGRYLFREQAGFFRERGIREIVTAAGERGARRLPAADGVHGGRRHGVPAGAALTPGSGDPSRVRLQQAISPSSSSRWFPVLVILSAAKELP